MQRHYLDSSFGQIHIRHLKAEGDKTATPLICLHPIPYSGLYFTRLMPRLNRGRDVLALDYPGYGGSDPLTDKPAIGDFAQAVIEALDNSHVAGPFDLLGFHTGCLVAGEISLLEPQQANRLVLIDVPYFDNASRERLYDQVTRGSAISTELECLAPAWEFNISNRINDMPLERAFALFVEQLRTGNNTTFGFHAAFTYPCEERFPKIKHPALVIATQSGLLAPSRQAAGMLADCTLRECLEIERAVMETGIEKIAKITDDYCRKN